MQLLSNRSVKFDMIKFLNPNIYKSWIDLSLNLDFKLQIKKMLLVLLLKKRTYDIETPVYLQS